MLELLDYRRHIDEMYRVVREMGSDAAGAHAHFQQVRNELFRTHPQSPLDGQQKATFQGLRYLDYDPAFRVVARVNIGVEPIRFELDLGEDGRATLQQFGQVSFQVPTGSGTLGLFWIAGYGGGLFLPFRDATNGAETYGGGRYLYDTIKGADLGATLDELVLDFNYAYHPSCHYNPRWVCPLAPPQNRLDFPIPAGEMTWQR
ncbi:MAG: DUF1684 domain-containing protein [Anaerolineae bacterium]|jgi:uncharacterized protein (DUF1684 family)